ncbi:hypothetical protein GOARA_036_01740 [Gordonia araii NBRC 100433]|uniref:Uncharacterized protein n=1 Tax=Gordonia araii NBRC 100433 TaxID=1073574 RepID=G7H0R6_9ACTN|nr:hypothetical protein [Gordonia araii]NNG96796.1 hypothetical protein [Gordonia araii NBRC 100433]GAB09441.1 hypothetical protein GOARA_036_01740 [Gordonia araii NBRC 100433]
MARHSSNYTPRGGGRSLLLAVLTALLVAGLVVSWLQARDRVGRQADQAAGTCVEGPATVAIIASPDIAEALGDIAKRFNDTKPVVRDHCITVQVRPGDSKVTLDGLTGNWEAASMGAFPAAWIPQSSVWGAQLTAANPDIVEDSPESLVKSPIVLALPTLFADKAGDLDWGRLPGLARLPNAMAQFGLPDWGPLRMAMPLGASSDATVLAAQAIAAQVSKASGPLTEAQANSGPVVDGIRTVLREAPPAPEGTAAATIAAMNTDDQRRAIHAVPITEQQLFLLGRTGAAGEKIRAFSPAGPTPVADYPVLRLSGNAVSTAQSYGAAQFIEFAQQPEQVKLLTELGYRSGDAQLPPGNTTVTFGPVEDAMPLPEPAASAAITKQVYR